MQPASQMLLSTVSDGEYTAPVTMNVDDQQHAAAVPPQPMPEYTLPIKKEMSESSPFHSADLSLSEDYLKPATVRPEPVGANDIPVSTMFEGSSLKNAGYRPDSVMVDSMAAEDNEEYINAEVETSKDGLLQESN